jgi:hypothetical protein
MIRSSRGSIRSPARQLAKLPQGIGMKPEFQVHEHGPADVGNVSTIHAALAYQMPKDVYIGLIRKTTDAIALIAGDAEYAPLVADLVHEGYRVDVHFWAEHVAIVI